MLKVTFRKRGFLLEPVIAIAKFGKVQLHLHRNSFMQIPVQYRLVKMVEVCNYGMQDFSN